MPTRLPEAQAAVLQAASTDAQAIETIADTTDLPEATVIGAAYDLAEQDLLTIEETTTDSIALTAEAAQYRDDDLPELRLYRAAIAADADTDAQPLDTVLEAAGLEGDTVEIALSNYARKGYGTIDNGTITADADADPSTDPEATALETIATGETPSDDVLDSLDRRGLIDRQDETTRRIKLTDTGVTALMEGIETQAGVGQLTPDLLTSGDWRDVEFAEYNVEADAETIYSGSVHPLRQTAERVKDVLTGMGFKEMDGPHADAEFWINDCLFMPQDHPARTHWDQFSLDVPPATDLPEDLIDRVRSAHREGVGEDGDGYHSPWAESVARQVDLRGHTTSLSMRYLSGFAQGDIDPPARYFSVEKAYRNDTIDATHLLEFFQIEGWVMAEDLSVRDLMGTFTEFYQHFGITDLQFKPTYNPYTEPSFELFGTHPTTGDLIEVGNSGLFRPEVLDPLDIECDVMAWGLALERLMMLMTGAEDIRDVHGTLVDLEFLRTEEVVY